MAVSVRSPETTYVPLLSTVYSVTPSSDETLTEPSAVVTAFSTLPVSDPESPPVSDPVSLPVSDPELDPESLPESDPVSDPVSLPVPDPAALTCLYTALENAPYLTFPFCLM